MHCRRKLQLVWIESTHLEEEHKATNPGEYHSAWHQLCTAHGILVPVCFSPFLYRDIHSNNSLRVALVSVAQKE